MSDETKQTAEALVTSEPTVTPEPDTYPTDHPDWRPWHGHEMPLEALSPRRVELAAEYTAYAAAARQIAAKVKELVDAELPEADALTEALARIQALEAENAALRAKLAVPVMEEAFPARALRFSR